MEWQKHKSGVWTCRWKLYRFFIVKIFYEDTPLYKVFRESIIEDSILSKIPFTSTCPNFDSVKEAKEDVELYVSVLSDELSSI